MKGKVCQFVKAVQFVIYQIAMQGEEVEIKVKITSSSPQMIIKIDVEEVDIKVEITSSSLQMMIKIDVLQDDD